MIQINLLGREAEQQSKGLRALRLPEIPSHATQYGIAAMFVVVLGTVGMTWWWQSGRGTLLRVELAGMQAERARLQEVADEVQSLRDRTDLLRQKLGVIVQLKANQTGPVMLLDQISRLLTDGLWLTHVELEARDVTIRGEALSDVSVSDFVQNLEESSYFDDVFLRTLGDSGEALRFEVGLRFEPLGELAAGAVAQLQPEEAR